MYIRFDVKLKLDLTILQRLCFLFLSVSRVPLDVVVLYHITGFYFIFYDVSQLFHHFSSSLVRNSKNFNIEVLPDSSMTFLGFVTQIHGGFTYLSNTATDSGHRRLAERNFNYWGSGCRIRDLFLAPVTFTEKMERERKKILNRI